jgi:hypothetical protein
VTCPFLNIRNSRSWNWNLNIRFSSLCHWNYYTILRLTIKTFYHCFRWLHEVQRLYKGRNFTTACNIGTYSSRHREGLINPSTHIPHRQIFLRTRLRKF